MLARCGRVAHICEANQILQSVFPVAIAFFETVKSAILWFVRNKLQIRTRQRGNCSMLAGKSRGGTPFCRTRKTVFFRSIVSKYRAAGKQKVFCSSNFSKMLARCGRAAHICEANMILESGFPAAIACFEIVQFKQSCIMRIKVANSDKATGQLQHAGRQKQGWNPLLPDAKDRFP